MNWLIALIGFYRRAISPVLRPRCRFVPSCSEFALDALRADGARGLGAALGRLARCGPWAHGGWDPYIFRGKRRHGRPSGAPGPVAGALGGK